MTAPASSKSGFILAAAVWTIALAALGLSVAAIESRALAERVAQAAALSRDRTASFTAAQEALFTYLVSERSHRGLEVERRIDRTRVRLAGPFRDESAERDVAIPLDGRGLSRGGVEVRLQDAGGLASLVAIASGPRISTLLKTLGAKETQAAAMVDALNDWRDGDDRRSLLGAEATDYRRSGQVGPSNALLRTVEELRHIRHWDGFVRSADDRLFDFFALNTQQWPNINTAPAEVLQAVYGLDGARLDGFLAGRPYASSAALTRAVERALDPRNLVLRPGAGLRIDVVGPETGLMRRSFFELTLGSRDGPWRLDYVRETRERRPDDDVAIPVFTLPDDPAAAR